MAVLLQCVAVCCSVVAVLLQCCCSVVAVLLQCCCSVVAVLLQCVADIPAWPLRALSFESVLQCVIVYCSVVAVLLQSVAVLQTYLHDYQESSRVEVYCSVLQCVAVLLQ